VSVKQECVRTTLHGSTHAFLRRTSCRQPVFAYKNLLHQNNDRIFVVYFGADAGLTRFKFKVKYSFIQVSRQSSTYYSVLSDYLVDKHEYDH